MAQGRGEKWHRFSECIIIHIGLCGKGALTDGFRCVLAVYIHICVYIHSVNM